MIERGEQARLAREAGAAFGIGGEVRWKDLDRHVATELAVARAIDLAHAAGAKWCDDAVRPELLSYHCFSNRRACKGASDSGCGTFKKLQEADSNRSRDSTS